MWRCVLIWMIVRITKDENKIKKTQKHTGITTLSRTILKIWLIATNISGYIPLKRHVSFLLHKWAIFTRMERKAKVNPIKTTHYPHPSTTNKSNIEDIQPLVQKLTNRIHLSKYTYVLTLISIPTAEEWNDADMTNDPGSCFLVSLQGWETNGRKTEWHRPHMLERQRTSWK